MYDSLSPAQAEDLASELRLQLSISGAQFQNVSVPLTSMLLTENVPINQLDESKFMAAAVTVRRSTIIAREVIRQRLRSHKVSR
jgi:hypothetical protein